MAFFVQRVYYVPHRDLLVLAGRPDPTVPVAGGAIDLPEDLKGPGWVPIADVQTIAFADGAERTCVIVDYTHLEQAPLMEFSDLEGKPLSLRRP
ncbi:MAG: hypothetical protein AAGA48_18180 [Myxococcota bacterium]